MPDAACETPEGAARQLTPQRGIMAMRDNRDRLYNLTGLKKWVRLHRSIFQAEKIDVLIRNAPQDLLSELFSFAREDNLVLSARVSANASPEHLETWLQRGLHDVFVCADASAQAGLAAWAGACQRLGIPMRVQLYAPFPASIRPEELAEQVQTAVAVNVTYWDPFDGPSGCRTKEEGLLAVRQMNHLVRALADKSIEANLLHLPFCLVDPPNLAHAQNELQFYTDHQHYKYAAYNFAVKICQRGTAWLETAAENQLSRRSSVHSALDGRLVSWILDNPRMHARTWIYHKLTRNRLWRRNPKPLPETLEACEAQVEKLRQKAAKKMGPVCAACKYQRVCAHETLFFREQLPGVPIQAQEGEHVATVCPKGEDRPRYFDPLDRKRLEWPQHVQALAQEARVLTLKEPPTREISTDTYDIQGHFAHHMPGAVRWMSLSTHELWSTPLPHLCPPFTLSLTFGGGIASHIGFAFGRYARIMCPMVDFSHRLVLHVDAEGYYALLRDGVLVRPSELEGEPGVPPRLAGRLEPHIAILNIDGQILTQTLLLWEPRETAPPRKPPKYSVLLVNSRYTRRLQAALLSLAHQRDFDLSQLEAMVCYIPGLDATDDLIDSMRAAYPELSILRMPFPEDCIKSKGFMINESIRSVAGEWILLMDADIALPPDTFARIEQVEDKAHFIAPDGRVMLSPETTGAILLGKVTPWDDCAAILDREKDIRHREAQGVPIGFFQCVRRKVFEKTGYAELDHFEASDWHFGDSVRKIFGKETRLEGFYVLHLDHGGSQWYGTTKHL